MRLSFPDYQQIENSSLFRSLSIDSLAPFLNECAVKDVSAASHLLEPGAANDSIYVILAGELRVHLAGSGLPAQVVLGGGDCVGELSLIDGAPVSALVVAASDARVLEIPHALVWKMVDASHAVARNLLTILSGRVRRGNQTLVATQIHSLEFEQTSSVDSLTGLHNRRWLETTVPRVLNRCERDGHPLCIMLVDVDQLNAVNERAGPAAGDKALRSLAARLDDGLRAQDMIARYGGEEFVIVLPRTEIDEAMLIAERLHEQVSAAPSLDFTEPEDTSTVSVGVAMHFAGETLAELVARAEGALAQAKETGGDRVEVAR
jgi:diguanylate cyclase (GGDEF)-like protein